MMWRRRVLLLMVVGLIAVGLQGLCATPQELAEGILSPEQWVLLLDSGLEGDAQQAALIGVPLQGFPTSGTEFVVLSSGVASDVAGTSGQGIAGVDGPLSVPGGSPDGYDAYDVVRLSIELELPGNADQLSFQFAFGTEENPSWIGSMYQDYFTAYVYDSRGALIGNAGLLPNGQTVTVDHADPYSNQPPVPDNVRYNAVTAGPLVGDIDVSALAGDTLTIVFEVGNASDSTSESAAFLDALRVLFCSIQTAVDRADPGAVLDIWPDTYVENVTIWKPLTLDGGDPLLCTIDGNHLGDTVMVRDVDVTIRNFEITGGNDGVETSSNNTAIENCLIYDNLGNGIDLSNSDVARIGGNEIYDNLGNGIHLYDSDAARIGGNEIYGNWMGIHLYDSDAARIDGNEIYGNNWDGIHLSFSDAARIGGNEIYDNYWMGILLYDSDAARVGGNEIYGNNRDGIYLSYSDAARIGGNEIYDNLGNGILLYDSDAARIGGNEIYGNGLYGIYLRGDSGAIVGNTVEDCEYGIAVDPVSDLTLIRLNVITGNHDGVDVGYVGLPAVGHTVLRYNAIEGNNPGGDPDWGGLWVAQGSTMVDAILNWWGSPDGPTQDVEGDGVAEYDGGGDWVIGPVIFSPWLGIDPDDDPDAVGVQMISPMLIVVDEVGPRPTEGYLNAAIVGANSVLLDGHDTIEVRPGTYDVDEEITDGVSILSTEGACETTLTGQIDIGTAGVLLGEIRNGFRIDGNVRVMPGQDASLSALHWNDIYGMVENAGSGTLDATYNFWGAGGPIVQTIGSVDAYPDLPLSSCTIIGYIDDYGMTVAETG